MSHVPELDCSLPLYSSCFNFSYSSKLPFSKGIDSKANVTGISFGSDVSNRIQSLSFQREDKDKEQCFRQTTYFRWLSSNLRELELKVILLLYTSKGNAVLNKTQVVDMNMLRK